MKKSLIHKLAVKLSHNKFFLVAVSIFAVFLFAGFLNPEKVSYDRNREVSKPLKEKKEKIAPNLPPLDTKAYDAKILSLANLPPPPAPLPTPTGESKPVTETPPPKPSLWPVKTVYPIPGAILPFKRIVAYYGNLYSKNMGVLGQYPEAEMLAKLSAEAKKWELADPATPVVPALHYIVTTAQLSPGEDGKYRLRMPDKEIDKIIEMADKIDALVFLDIQVGFSNLQSELPRLEKYFKMPGVHLGIDPEFSMKSGIRPGKIVGTMDASDVNYAADFLAKIVRDNNLPPKVLVVHRYTQKMVTNYKLIKPLPEVQIVMDMDGWGGAAKKKNTYQQFIYKEPVQFTGFKLFYKNDILTPGTVVMSPSEVLKLSPQPSYIQYQ